ncbi:MAG: NAD(P)H-dependent oxidoreductase [Enterococcus sp.]
MKTLIIVSHPTLEESETQQFFKAASISEDVTWHHLEEEYPLFNIDSAKELGLLAAHQRIIFQFPFYWYSAPAHLKLWEDQVLDKVGNLLKGKSLGIVLTLGVAQKEYQAGGREEYTISEFLRPYQRIANKFEMEYLPPFICAQFPYQSEEERSQLLISYQQYLTLSRLPSLAERSDWILTKLRKLSQDKPNMEEFSLIITAIEENSYQIEDLTDTLQLMKEE